MTSHNLQTHTTQYKPVAVPVNVGRCAIHTDTTDGLRLWLIARTLDTTGTGKTTRTALFDGLPRFGVTMSYGYYRKVLNKYTGTYADGRDGSDDTPVNFWNYNPTTGVIYLHSVSNVGAQLYKATINTATSDRHKQILINNMPTHRRVFVPVSGSIGLFNAQLYKAWISVHGGKLSRDTMTVLFNVSDETQRHYERIAGVTVERTDICVYGSEIAQSEHGVLIPVERARARHSTNDTQYTYQHTNYYTAITNQQKTYGQAERVKTACSKVLSKHTPVINRVDGQKLYFDNLRAYTKHVKRHGHSDNMLVFTVWTNARTGKRRLVYRQMVSIYCAQNLGHNRVTHTRTVQVSHDTTPKKVKRASSDTGHTITITRPAHKTDTQPIPDTATTGAWFTADTQTQHDNRLNPDGSLSNTRAVNCLSSAKNQSELHDTKPHQRLIKFDPQYVIQFAGKTQADILAEHGIHTDNRLNPDDSLSNARAVNYLSSARQQNSDSNRLNPDGSLSNAYTADIFTRARQKEVLQHTDELAEWAQ